jgi:rSAM/selenodomain-associated transferase 1
MKSTRTIVFAKAPLAGFAKTRLIPALGREGAATLARNMLMGTLHEAISADIGAVELCVTPAIQDPAWQGVVFPTGIEISEQGGGDLGERLSRAAARAFSNTESALLIGTDCVEMSSTLLRNAAQALHEYDAAIHCTTDGGYALLGLNRFSPLLFSDIPWSTSKVASLTSDRIRQLGWSLHIGEILRDVDEPQDMEFLPGNWSVHAVA